MNSIQKLLAARKGIKAVDEVMKEPEYSKYLMQHLEQGTDYYYRMIEPQMMEVAYMAEGGKLPKLKFFKTMGNMALIYYAYKTTKRKGEANE